MEYSHLPQYAEIFETLHTAWETVQTSQTMRIVFIEGESGMNKSVLVRKFLDTCQAPCIVGRCSDIPEPYLPLRLAYESLLESAIVQEQLQKAPEAVTDEQWKIALTTFAQALRMVPPTGNPVWEQLQPWQPREAVSERVVPEGIETGERPQPVSLPELFTFSVGDVAGIAPVVLFFQELDLADRATLEALGRIVLPGLKENPVLLVVDFETPRKEQASSMEEFLDIARDVPGTARFTLAPLSAEDIQQLARTEFRQLFHRIPDEQRESFFHRICQYSSGNFARSLDLLFWIEQAEGRDPCKTLEALPDFNGILQTKFGQAGEREQRFLQMAAIHGYHFCLPVVARALEYNADEIGQILSHVSRETGGWVRLNVTTQIGKQTAEWYQFLGTPRHQLIQSSIPRQQQREFSQKIAGAIEQVYSGNVTAVAGLLALKSEQGGMQEKAADYWAIVAQQANKQGDYDLGLDYASRGLKNLAQLQENPEVKKLQCRLLIEQGYARHATEQAHLSLDAMRTAYKLAKELNDTSLLTRAGRYLGQILLDHNNWDEGLEVSARALQSAIAQKDWAMIAEEMEDLRERYQKSGASGQTYFFTLCDNLMAAIESDVSPEVQVMKAEILENKGWLHHRRDEHEAAIDAFQQALDSLSALERPALYPNIHYKLYRGLAMAFRALGRYSRSLQESEQAIRWANAGFQRKDQVLARYAKAKTLEWMGEVDQGEQVLEAALRLFEHSSDLDTLSQFENDYGFFLSKTGRKRRAREMYRRSYTHKRAAHRLERLQKAINNIAAIDTVLGSFQSALTAYQQLLHEGIAQGDKHRQRLSFNHIGEIYRIQNRLRESEQSLAQAIQLCDDLHALAGKATSLRNLCQTYLVNWNIEQAAAALLEAEKLQQNKLGVSDHINYDTHIFLGRLQLCQRRIAEAIQTLNDAVKGLETIQHLLWVGIGYVNLGLAYLSDGRAGQALAGAQLALEQFQFTESWRVSETHHLLARCYLALGDLEQAQQEIEQARVLFMKFKLFHRVHQVENTELKVEEARETGNFKQCQTLGADELREDFNHLGI